MVWGWRASIEVDRAVVFDVARKRSLDRIQALEDDVSGFRLDLGLVEHQRQRRAGPFGDAAPALDAIVPRDLGAARHCHQLVAAERQRLFDKAGDFQPPVGEILRQQALVDGVVGRGDAVRPLRLADVGLGEFLGERVAAAQQALHAIGEVIGALEDIAQAAVRRRDRRIRRSRTAPGLNRRPPLP